jgi:hypothetical protein
MVAHTVRKHFTSAQAAAVADMLGIDLATEGIELEALRRGMEVELEHGSRDPLTNVTDDRPILTGKIALAHLREMPDYYERLEEMERRARPDAATDEVELSHIWLQFEHQFDGRDERHITVPDAG